MPWTVPAPGHQYKLVNTLNPSYTGLHFTVNGTSQSVFVPLGKVIQLIGPCSTQPQHIDSTQDGYSCATYEGLTIRVPNGYFGTPYLVYEHIARRSKTRRNRRASRRTRSRKGRRN